MLRVIAIFSLLSFWSTALVAQDMMFDEMHITDGAIFLKSVDGEEITVDASGNVITAHPVFRLSASERAEKSWAKTVTRQNNSEYGRNEIVQLCEGT